jgi:hypothetical protein
MGFSARVRGPHSYELVVSIYIDISSPPLAAADNDFFLAALSFLAAALATLASSSPLCLSSVFALSSVTWSSVPCTGRQCAGSKGTSLQRYKLHLKAKA